MRHPIGMTVRGRAGTTAELLASGADWIATKSRTMLRNPDAADGSKVVVLDTDHFAPYTTDETFVWRAVLRGNHVLALDRLDDLSGRSPHAALRSALGRAVRVASQVSLARLSPRGDLSSTGYCLAEPGREYLVWAPAGRRLRVDLRGAPGSYRATWWHPLADHAEAGDRVEGGRWTELHPPFASGALLHLRAERDLED